jgi:SIR2-like domain
MLMVIFGAGASYDSCSTYPPGSRLHTGEDLDKFFRPPLANELFDNRPLFNSTLDQFPQVKPVLSRLRASSEGKSDKPVEAILQEIEMQSTTYQRARTELLAVRCYLQKVIANTGRRWLEASRTGGITNQLTLLREIERTRSDDEPVCLVTFNYDLLLENALGQLGYTYVQMDDYTRTPKLFRLFKLHGSVDWARELKVSFPGNLNTSHEPSFLKYLIENGTEPRETDPFVLRPSTTMEPGNGLPLLPAIAIPVENKNTFECPRTILDDLRHSIPAVTRILIIGWQARENHFLAMLRSDMSQLRQVMVIGKDNKESGEILDHFLKSIGKSELQPKCEAGATGFTNFILANGPARFFQA